MIVYNNLRDEGYYFFEPDGNVPAKISLSNHKNQLYIQSKKKALIYFFRTLWERSLKETQSSKH